MSDNNGIYRGGTIFDNYLDKINKALILRGRKIESAKDEQQKAERAEQGETVRPNVRLNTSVPSSSISNISNDELEGRSIDEKSGIEERIERIEEIKKGISEYIVFYKSPTQNLLEEDQKKLQELQEQLEQKRNENQKVGFFKGLGNRLSGKNKQIDDECKKIQEDIDRFKKDWVKAAFMEKKQTLDNSITSMETLDMAAIDEVTDYILEEIINIDADLKSQKAIEKEYHKKFIFAKTETEKSEAFAGMESQRKKINDLNKLIGQIEKKRQTLLTIKLKKGEQQKEKSGVNAPSLKNSAYYAVMHNGTDTNDTLDARGAVERSENERKGVGQEQ